MTDLPPTVLETAAADLPPVTSITAVNDLFFYTQAGAEPPVLVKVNLLDGTFATVENPPELFPTALNGLLAAEPTDAPWLIDLGLSDNSALALAQTSLAAEETGLGGEVLFSATAAVEPQTFALVTGSDRKNFLIGPDENAALFGLGGEDLILVGMGNNLAFGGTANDTLLGGPGDNILFGNEGNDELEGGDGNATLFGGEGDDILYGGAGANVLIGGAGADLFRLGKPEPSPLSLVGADEPTATPASDLPDIIVDFSLAEGDILDLSLIAASPSFVGSDLLSFLNAVQVGDHTHLQITTPLGQTTTEAILLNVEANTLTAEAFRLIPPDGLSIFK